MGNRSALAQRADRTALVGARRELTALDAMTVGELAEKYREVFGVPTRSRNKDYLRRHVAWRIQEQLEGGLSQRALDRVEQLAPQGQVPWRTTLPKPRQAERGAAPSRDPRLPRAGTVLTRLHDGVEHQVKVLDDGFEYQGQRYRSLSQIAKLITGTPWNGFTFFLGRAAGQRDGAEGAA